MQTFITRESDYALRIVAFLAGLQPVRTIPVSEIAKQLNISKNYTARIIHTLRKEGIIRTVQGVNGGVYLGRNAEEISLYEILKAMNLKACLNECLANEEICAFPSICKIHKLLAEEEEKLILALKRSYISEYSFDEETVQKINKSKQTKSKEKSI